MTKKNLKKISANVWEIQRSGDMKVPGRIYANERLLPTIFKDNSLQQVKNVACLPGIQKFSLAMPDIHQGYGFPIGGVAAMNAETGVISPGGVGYDINCGVRSVGTNFCLEDIDNKLVELTENIFRIVPTGVGSRNKMLSLSFSELKKVLQTGTKWAVLNGFGSETDLESIEEFGVLNSAKSEKVSDRALRRGANQLGTLGSGNHFIEIGMIKEIFDEIIAEKFHLLKNQIIVTIHTGSRGLGYQVCDDYVHKMLLENQRQRIQLPDRQLASVYINSQTGQDYFAAMSAAANFAWANRQIIMGLVQKAFKKTFKSDNFEFGLIYDVCHNIAKFEEHEIDGKIKKVCVHRKGATRAFGPGRKELAEKFWDTGQPVIIPGDMGTESYICVGTEKAMRETFGSSCHGAGRVLSRHQALRTKNYQEIMRTLKRKHIVIKAAKQKTVVEEMSEAYKNVTEVVQTMHDAGIIRKVVRMIPVAVIKG